MTQVPGISLQIKQANMNEDVKITYKSVYNPHKTLGHYKVPAGMSKVQENILINKAESYACKVKRSSLNRYKSWLYYTSCYLKSLGYVLGKHFFPNTHWKVSTDLPTEHSNKSVITMAI